MAVAWPLNADGVWIELRSERRTKSTPTLFLDRDGVVIDDLGYVGRPADVALISGAAELIAAANRAGIAVAVATNQSAIARKLFGWEAFAAVMRRIDDLLAVGEAKLDAVAACPFHPDFTPSYGPVHAAWRKPGPRMILELARLLNADLERSWFLGDKDLDIEAADAAGIGAAILVRQPSDLAATRARILDSIS